MAGVEPTAMEVYFITLINRARTNPTGEAARYGITINEGLPADTISRTPLPPLAINARCQSVAGHAIRLIEPAAGARSRRRP